MFCTNCGSELPDGSKFCSVCGEKLPEQETQDKIKSSSERKAPSISFDWSNVQDEHHKRDVVDAHSPWGTVGLDKKDIEPEDMGTMDELSRTMSFIDILRKEKEEREEREQHVADEYMDQPVVSSERFNFENKREDADLYVPPLYDIEDEVKTPFEDETSLDNKNSKIDSNDVTFATMDFTTKDVNSYSPQVENSFEPTIDRENLFEPDSEYSEYIDEPVDSLDDNTVEDLEAELADILSTGTEQKQEEPVVEQKVVEDVSESENQIELNSPIEEHVEKEEKEKIETVSEKSIVDETTNSPENEIEDLKRRLAELAGETAPVEEVVEESAIEESTQEKENLEIELVEDEKPVEPESDAMSLDELEKELGVDSTEEEILAEATKKIDKFYTLYKKNEEFQKLLDEEYSMLNSENEVPHVDEIVSKTGDVETPEPISKPVVEEKTESKEIEPKVETVETEKQQEKVKPTEENQSVKESKPVEAKVESSEPKITKEEKQAQKEAKKAEKLAKKKEKAENGEAGSKLTILAVIIVIILVLVLAMILILYCAPNSAIALKIDQFIQTLTSYFSGIDVIKGYFLL